MKDERDEGEPPTAVLTRLDELVHLLGHLGRRLVADRSASALQNVVGAQAIHFRPHLFGAPSQTGSQALAVEHDVGVSVEEHEDVPRQQSADVTFDEFDNRGPEDPLQVIHQRPSLIGRKGHANLDVRV